MSNTIQKYKDYVMTGFLKSVAPIVIDRASGVRVWDENGREYCGNALWIALAAGITIGLIAWGFSQEGSGLPATP